MTDDDLRRRQERARAKGNPLVLLAPDAEQALRNLPPLCRRFVLAYCGFACGEVGPAAQRAGVTTRQGATWLERADVKEAIQLISVQGVEDRHIMAVHELRQLWTQWACDIDLPIKFRMKAAETLGRSLGAFIERVEVTDQRADLSSASTEALLQARAALVALRGNASVSELAPLQLSQRALQAPPAPAVSGLDSKN